MLQKERVIMRHSGWRGILSIVVVGAVLEALELAGLVDPLIFTRPTSILRATGNLLGSLGFLHDLLLTVLRVLASVSIGGLVGVILGILLGALPKAYSYVEGPLHGLRSIPSSAFYPIVILLFGIGNSSAIAMAALPTALITLIAAVAGVRGAHRGRRDLRKILGLSNWIYFRQVLLWEAAPQIMTGLRASASYALVIIVALELFVGGYTGIGQRLSRYQAQYDIANVYATLLVAGCLGYFLNCVLGRVEGRLTHWVGQ